MSRTKSRASRSSEPRSQIEVPLSKLVPGRRNPRKVKPSRDAHQRLVALIRSQGLIQPLVVRPADGKPGHYAVIAGERRLAALREINKGNGDPKIDCVLRDVDVDTADGLSLAENFAREPMHPLDEAEAFDRLATQDGKDADAIAAEFGVTPRFVRQRMKLAGLVPAVKSAYRNGDIDTAAAEAFASVPPDRQKTVWQETENSSRHAQHIRNVIAHEWIDAAHALFDVATLPAPVVSQDLFSDRVLVERSAFMETQAAAVAVERDKLLEDGWKEVVIGNYDDVQDRLRSLEMPEREFDADASAKLAKLGERYRKLEEKLAELDEDDEKANDAIQAKFEALEVEEQEITQNAKVFYSDATKSIGTAFLVILPDGQVRRDYRVPRRSRRAEAANGHAGVNGSTSSGAGSPAEPAVPTSDELNDRQLATSYTHQAIAVREALLRDAAARKRVLALLLHPSVHAESLSVRHDPNAVTLSAEQGTSSAAWSTLKAQQGKVDPFADDSFVRDEVEAYERVAKLSAAKLEALIDLLVVQCLTTHLQRGTKLMERLTAELNVNVRNDWTPNGEWFSAFTKAQLAHLLVTLRGPMHAPAPDRKKSDLVTQLAVLFEQARDGKLDDKALAAKVNAWLPSNLRPSADNNSERSK